MISRNLMHHLPVAVPAAAEVELQRALWSWKSQCEEGAAALGRRDLDALDAALAAREALRPTIGALVRQLQDKGGTPREPLATLRRLQQAAADADHRLMALLESERTRIQNEIDGLGRRSAPAAYEPAAMPRHRLDIRR